MHNIVKVSSVLMLKGSIAWAQQPHHGSPAHGADHGADAVSTDATAFDLPEACRQAEHPVGEMGGMAEMTGEGQVMLEHLQAKMESMMRTHGPMMQGMMLDDSDLAFACAMIPHHKGAIVQGAGPAPVRRR